MQKKKKKALARAKIKNESSKAWELEEWN